MYWRLSNSCPVQPVSLEPPRIDFDLISVSAVLQTAWGAAGRVLKYAPAMWGAPRGAHPPGEGSQPQRETPLIGVWVIVCVLVKGALHDAACWVLRLRIPWSMCIESLGQARPGSDPVAVVWVGNNSKFMWAFSFCFFFGSAGQICWSGKKN